jgi:CheY-like chemotaxis protein
LNVAGYLVKPVRRSDLRDAIARTLGSQHHELPSEEVTQGLQKATRQAGLSLKILLAEDNQVNQRLATRLLEKRGYEVTVVDNGREALDALARSAFDLVLMDVQMPVLDGIEAVMEIRLNETGKPFHQRVVALTAHAMKGDEERCLAAGMDGYLSKPIRQQELDGILDSYFPGLREPSASELLKVQMPADFVDEAVLLDRVGGDRAFLSELTELFRIEYPRQLSYARQALAEENSDGVMQAAHALRGVLANLAATGPSETGATLEEIGNSGDLSMAGPTLDRLEEELQSVLRTLESFCDKASQ